MKTKDENGFRLLWPILFLERTLPGHEQANGELERLILEREAAKENLTTAYREESFFAMDNPAIAWLRQCNTPLDRRVLPARRHELRDRLVATGLGPNVNRLGDYHDPHNYHQHQFQSDGAGPDALSARAMRPTQKGGSPRPRILL